MADLVLGLAKTTVEGTVTMARSAMEEEEKLQKSVQRDLLVISDEFEMMHAFLEDAKGRVTDNVTRTLVRQVRNTALDVEDCIETIVHLDHKPHWLRRMMCMPAATPAKDLDAVVASVEQLKARVDAIGHRKLRYNRITDCCHKPAAEHQQHAIATGATTGTAKQNSQVDLIMLINGRKTNDESGPIEGGAESDQELQDKKNDDEKEDKNDGIAEVGEEEMGNKKEEVGNESKVEQEVGDDDVHELKVISVLGTGSDLEMISIKKAYDDQETCKTFTCRAWVKLVHPFNPIEFIRSLLAQFQKNSACPEPENTAKVLNVTVATDVVLLDLFQRQIRQKYLVVLEDMSTIVDWEAISGYLPDNKNRSCIIVHTRHHGIAYSCVGHGYRVSELEMLLADHSVQVLVKEDAVAGKVIDEDTVNGNESKYEDWENENPLFGRDEDLRWLQYTYSGGIVVSVWGISGVGISFLIQHFWHRGLGAINFVRLNVSRPFDLRGLQRSLHSQIQNHPPEGPIQWEDLQGGYSIVIDGLQSREEWDSIRPTFESTPQKSNTTSSRIPYNVCIFIITNEESVANYCATKADYVRNIRSLEVGHAIQLFEQQVAQKSNYWKWEQRVEDGRYRSGQTRDILLRKCGGFPKVICAVAESWGMFCDIKVKDNLVSKLEAKGPITTGSLEGIFSWLRSYFGSCPDFLKPCIFYLTIFPVNHTIRRRRLVRRWIVEGYTWNNKQITAEETANGFFSRLVNLNMIQPPRQSNLASFTRIPLCQVNGFIREYVLSRSMEENFVFELEGNCKDLQRDPGTNHDYTKGMAMGCIVQHLAIDKSWDRDRNVFQSIDLSRLRSLTVFGRWESFFISDKMGRLRVLDLEDVSSGLTNGDVEKMVKLLPRLKFLSLRGCQEITHLPGSLGDLKELQTLDVRGTSVTNLPKSIIKLEKLQYVRAGTAVNLDNDAAFTSESLQVAAAAAANPSTSSATSIAKPRATLGSCLSKFSNHRHLFDDPRNGINVLRGIGKLTSLHTLGVVNISAAGGEDILEELKNLTLLHKLGVSGINRNNSEKFFSAISHLAHLESLCLQFQLSQDHEAAVCMGGLLSPLVKLRSLKLYGLVDRLPAWIKQMWLQLHGLQKFDLQMKMLHQDELDSIITLRGLHCLHLRLEEFEHGELRFGWTIPRSSGGWILDLLEIACNSRLQKVRFASSVRIEVLKIRCSSVSSSLQFSGLPSMERLKEVWLTGSYNDALKKHLTDELASSSEYGNKPILLTPDELSSS